MPLFCRCVWRHRGLSWAGMLMAPVGAAGGGRGGGGSAAEDPQQEGAGWTSGIRQAALPGAASVVLFGGVLQADAARQRLMAFLACRGKAHMDSAASALSSAWAVQERR